MPVLGIQDTGYRGDALDQSINPDDDDGGDDDDDDDDDDD